MDTLVCLLIKSIKHALVAPVASKYIYYYQQANNTSKHPEN